MHEKTSAQPIQSTPAEQSTLRFKRRSVFALLVLVGAIVALLAIPGWKHRARRAYASLPVSPIVHAAEINPWTLAVEKIKEDRGEPAGRKAQVDIPSEVRHYSDTRRFLAIQVAEVRQHHIETPRDFVDLADLIQRGEMVPLKPVTENYVLFGVGGSASNQPFTRYENGTSIPLYNQAGLEQENSRLAASRLKLEGSIASLKKELASLKKRDRSARASVQGRLSATEKTLAAERQAKASLDKSYGNPVTRSRLFDDYGSLAKVAKSFPDRNFNIEDSAERQRLKIRLLSSLRPQAFKVMDEIATAYREKFNRPLPITSLVRPDEYQHTLSKTNPNATRIDTPPHSTGLAFDVFYGFMTAEEQAFVMSRLAQLKDEARIEVLRENRDHYHVFAFVDGARPDESMIAATLGTTATANPRVAVRESHHAQLSSKKAKAKASSKKASSAKSRTRKRR